MREDKVLCHAAQKNLERGVFVNGLMHPKFEKAPLFFQKGVREAVAEHWQGEKASGGEIWPASRAAGGEDEEMCKRIECGGGEKGALEW